MNTRDNSFELKQKNEFDKIFQAASMADSLAANIEFESLLEFMGDLRDKRVLDLGCGVGRRGMQLARHAGEVIGYDISEVAVERANATATSQGIVNFRAEINNFSDVAEESFDVVLCVNMLHHTQDPRAVLASINKALRKGGQLVILENNPVNPLFPFYFVLIGQVRAHLTRQYFMVNRFQLRKMIASAGMTMSSMKRYGFLPTMLYDYSLHFKSLNEMLNRIPLLNEFTAFHFIKVEKGDASAPLPPRPRHKASYLRAGGLLVMSLMPFLYPMRHVITGRVFAGFGKYIANVFRYRRAESKAKSGFPLKLRNAYPCLLDRYENAGSIPRHYFWQDLWGARRVFESKAPRHYDIGSRLDGFIAHCLPFCEVVVLDIRPSPIELPIPNLSFVQANCMDMKQIADDSIPSLSSFHALEHFGLGRYGDPIDPLGYAKAISEMKRIIAPGGSIFVGVPIGEQRVEFDGHRVFDPMEIIRRFEGLELVEFSAIDDDNAFHANVSPQDFRSVTYGCGLFHFKKRARG
jgi:SAM-dependent methyltransferase